MNELITGILEWTSHQGVGVTMLILALVFMYKKQKKDAINNAREIRRAWDAKEESEVSRFKEMQDRLNASDARHEVCEKHRLQLNAQLFQLALLSPNKEALKLASLPDESAQ